MFWMNRSLKSCLNRLESVGTCWTIRICPTVLEQGKSGKSRFAGRKGIFWLLLDMLEQFDRK